MLTLISAFNSPHIHDQFYCQIFHIVQSYWPCMGGIDAKILYETIDINYIVSIKLSVYGPCTLYAVIDVKKPVIGRLIIV